MIAKQHCVLWPPTAEMETRHIEYLRPASFNASHLIPAQYCLWLRFKGEWTNKVCTSRFGYIFEPRYFLSWWVLSPTLSEVLFFSSLTLYDCHNRR